MRRVMVLALLALGCVFLTEAPAQACERPVPSVSQALQRSSFVFNGTVRKVTSAGDQTTYAVAVDRVYQGRVDQSVMVTAPRTKADCGLRGFGRGDQVMFVTRDGSGDRFTTASFEGSRPLTPQVRAAVVDELGRGSKPIAPPPAAEEPPLEMIVLDDGHTMSFAALALPGGILIALGLVLLLTAQVLGRRPAGS
ncbi:MAG: hypothetical protein ABWX84_12455 [Nocardioides sp.]